MRKSNSGGSAASAEREYVLSGAIKKDSENGADKMARQLSKYASCTGVAGHSVSSTWGRAHGQARLSRTCMAVAVVSDTASWSYEDLPASCFELPTV